MLECFSSADQSLGHEDQDKAIRLRGKPRTCAMFDTKWRAVTLISDFMLIFTNHDDFEDLDLFSKHTLSFLL